MTASTAATAASDLPSRARVVVIGGGVIGCSVAYHLAQEGWTDVVLLERDRLTSGTTWHAAGLIVTFGSLSETSTRFRQYSRDLYTRLEAETGQSTGFKPVGFIEVASEPGRLEEYRRVAAFNRYCGVDVQEISAKEVQGLFPAARVDDVLAGFYVPGDGRANPVDVTMALAKGARQGGVRIVESTPVLDVLVADAGTPRARVTGVRTARGDVECEVVVNCAGMWARELAARSGVTVALQSAEHYYLITEDIPGISPDWPVLEDPANYAYIREEVGGLMVGLFEGVAAPWKVEGVPADFSFGSIPPDWDRMGPYVEAAMSRVPATLDAGIRTFFCGPESFTPDLQPVVGEAVEVKGYFVAAGLNSIGILTGGGLGQALAHWIVAGTPQVDVTGFDIARLHPYQTTPSYRRERTTESLGNVYQCHYPNKATRTARGAKHSPLHARHLAEGAYLRDVSGWESPDVFFGPGATPDPGPLTFGRPSWFGLWEAEHRACREGVVLMDMSFMAKLLVQGRDAGAVLDRLSANHVDGEPGRITYTQWLNAAGTLEADLTVTKLGPEEFLVVASDTAHRHALSLVRRALATESFLGNGSGAPHAFVTDVTSGYAQLNVQGPRSREVLQALTSVDLSNEAFGFRTARTIDLGYAQVLCVRITYLGELGYELYVPTEHALGVYDRIRSAGAGLGLRLAGLKALASLRMEKAYRDYGHDIDNTDTVDEAGLGFAVALTRRLPDGSRVDRPFVGRDAVLVQRSRWAAGAPAASGAGGAAGSAGVFGAAGAAGAAGVSGAGGAAGWTSGPVVPPRRLAQVLVTDPEPLLYHAEVLRRNGSPVGYVRAASYGHTLGGAVGLAMLEPAEADRTSGPVTVTQDWIDGGTWDVEIAGNRYPATVSLTPLYDPKNTRIRS